MKKIEIIIIMLAVFCLYPICVQASSDIVVMLDPGHGGTESGAVSGGMVEKDLTWKITTRVKQILDNTSGIKGILTKDEKETLNRYDRAERAKNNNADLLVSFHINSNDSSNKLSGAEVYITHNTTQKRYYEYSNKLGLNILENLRNVGIPSFAFKPKVRVGTPNDVYSDGTVADYYGIISWPMHFEIPSILIEHCFINNPSDRDNYLNDTMLNRMAEADAKAIIDNKELFRVDKTRNSIGLGLKELQMGKTSNNQTYICGEVYINNWINGIARSPEQLPKIRLVSTDRSKSYEMWVVNRKENLYYFDSLIEQVDKNYEYYIEVESQEKDLIPIYHTGNIEISNKELGKMGKETVKVANNKIVFEYPAYEGEINADIKEIEMQQLENNNILITGKIDVTETINGTKEAQIRRPKIYLEDTNSKKINQFTVSQLSESTYKITLEISNFKSDKKYVIKVQSGNLSNLSTKKIKIANYNKNCVLLEKSRIKVTIMDNEIRVSPIQYSGDIGTGLLEFNMRKNNEGKAYVYGNVVINEWIDGTGNIPDIIPSIKIKAIDGSVEYDCWVINTKENQYYFDSYIEGIDVEKEYEIEATLQNTYNVSKYIKANILEDQEKKLGKYDESIVWIKNGKMVFKLDTYQGDIGNEIKDIYLNKNREGKYYISGNVYVTEWINGTIWSVPSKTPKITIKTREGKEAYEAWVSKVTGNEYYFDSYIEDIDVSKEYVIEIELVGKANVSKNKIGRAYFVKDMKLGKYKGKEMKVQNSIISFEGDEYRGDIGQQLDWIQVNQSSVGKTYINGNIYITEWIEGKEWSEPRELPKIRIKTVEGEEVYNAWVSNIGGNKYYFDSYIEGIDTTREYVIEVELASKNNISNYKKGNVVFGTTEKSIGEYKEKKIIVERDRIRFEGVTYNGDLGQQLDWIQLNQNNEGKTYINGNIYITEWINGIKWSIPEGTPKIKIRTVEGEEVYNAWVSNIGENKYYFDSYIEEIDVSKEYEIEIELSNPNNLSTNKKGKVDFGRQRKLGEYREYEVQIQDSKIKFIKLKSEKKQEIKEEPQEAEKSEVIEESLEEVNKSKVEEELKETTEKKESVEEEKNEIEEEERIELEEVLEQEEKTEISK